VERPAVGTSCCASTAEAIVAQEMAMLSGVKDVAIDSTAGIVEISYDPSSVSLADIAAALEEIGYPPQP
jgi:copper chaperone CopZ